VIDLAEIMQALEALGNPQTHKIYSRHGVTGAQFGISAANMQTLSKRMKKDHGLALQLWATDNHDARILALLVADPNSVEEATLDSWVHQLTNYVICDAFTSFAAQTRFLQPKAESWIDADGEWIESAGWGLLSHLASQSALPDSYFEPYLVRIERDIHHAKNRVRYAMNGALITIGVRTSGLEMLMLPSAERIGEVIVDHGETGCKTPDAVDYIAKVKAREAQKVKRAAEKATQKASLNL